MPSSQSWRMPVWVPFALAGAAVIVFVFCAMHLGKRAKARWPW